MGLRNRQVAIAVAIVLIAVSWIVVTGMRETMVYYYTVSELDALGGELVGEPLRVAGHVVPGTIRKGEDDLVHRFVIQEGGKTMAVEYRGIAPDTFQDEAEAVVEGEMGEDGVFRATFLMAKCPSKYEAATDYSEYREAGLAAPAQSR